MAQVNPLTREILVKLVYYGPGLGGKTTSLQRIHSESPPETRGQIVSLATPVDRTLYFDFLPLRATTIRNHHVRLQLFTVPGQVYFNATRKLVLTGADGVVFVADSQPARQDANLESLENLAANLEEQGRSLEEMPLVLQYNKRDLPTVMDVHEMNDALNALGVPWFETSATTGQGIMDALDSLVQAVLDDLERRNVLGEEGIPAEAPDFSRAEDAFSEQIGKASEKIWQTSYAHSSAPSAPASAPARAAASPVPPVAPAVGAAVVAVPSPAPASAASPQTEPTRPGDEFEETDTRPPPAGRVARLDPLLSGASLGETPSRVPPLDRTGVGPSWAPLFGDDAEEVRAIETDLAVGRIREAILRCDGLARTLLLAAGRQAGLTEAVQEPALVAPLLGLEGDRWFAFQRLVRRTRAGGPLDRVDGLHALATLIEIRLRRDRLLA